MKTTKTTTTPDRIATLLPPNTEITVKVSWVSSTGLNRVIQFFANDVDVSQDIAALADLRYVDDCYKEGRNYKDRRGALCGGCGMDVAFAALYEATKTLGYSLTYRGYPVKHPSVKE